MTSHRCPVLCVWRVSTRGCIVINLIVRVWHRDGTMFIVSTRAADAEFCGALLLVIAPGHARDGSEICVVDGEVRSGHRSR